MSKSKSIENKLSGYRALIFNSRDKKIAPLLTEVGADSEYIDQGEALYNEFLAQADNQTDEYQDQSKAYDQFNSESGAVTNAFDKTYKLVSNFARYDQDLVDRLRLKSGKSMPIEKWFKNANDFYNRVKKEQAFVDKKLTKFKITQERLQKEKQSVKDLKMIRTKAVNEKGDAQEATRLRNKKLEALDDYCTDLRTLAEVALEEQPQLMEKLGILVRSDY